MTQVQSNAHRVEVIAAGNALAAAAAALSSGQWAQMSPTPTGLSLFTGQAGSSGIATHYAAHMPYDAVAKKFYFIGCDHGAPDIFVVYDEATNAWTNAAASVPWGINQGGITAHSYNHMAWDSSRRVLYFRPGPGATSFELRSWNSGTSWTSHDYSAGWFYHAAANGVCYFPEMDRILIYQLENTPKGSLKSYNPADGTSTILVTEASGVLQPCGDPHNVATYNPTSQVVVFGGGGGVTTLWKINSAGTITAMPAIPGAVGSLGPATGYARIWPNPTNGKFLVIKNATIWYDLDPTGSGTWTARGGSIPMLTSNVLDSANPLDGVIGVSMPAYGVIAFIKSYQASSPAQMWLFKP